MTQRNSSHASIKISIPLCLAFFVCLSTIFLLNREITYGHDYGYFIFRLEGISQGLAHGEFPVRIQTSQINGYGYPVGIMFGDLLYYPAAIPHCFGLSLENAYRLILLTVNTVTVFFGYYAFSKLTGSKIYGLFGTSLYTLAYYRLSDITLRADIGEAFGMAFLPIALLGYFLVLHDNKNINGEAVKSVIPNWLLLGLSVSGIIISNVPLTVLCVFFLFLSYIVCLLLFPNVRSLTVLLDLEKQL